MTTASPTALLWFRQDLRLHDNPALIEALAGAPHIIPVYVLDDQIFGSWRMGGASRWWLHHSLSALAASLKQAGARLTLRRGHAATIIPALAAEAHAATVHAGIAHEPAWRACDDRVAAALQADGRRLVLHRTATLADLSAIRTRTG